MKLPAKLIRLSIIGLIRFACGLALVGLAIMSFAIVSGRPLPVVLAMSVGHMVGMASLACFLLAVFIDATRPLVIDENRAPLDANTDSKSIE